MYAWVSNPENSPKAQLDSSQIPSDKNGFSGQNYPGWINKKADDLMAQLELEFNPKKRIELAHQIAKYYTDDIPVIPLFYRADIGVPPLTLKNFKLTGHQFVETNSAETWEIK